MQEDRLAFKGDLNSTSMDLGDPTNLPMKRREAQPANTLASAPFPVREATDADISP